MKKLLVMGLLVIAGSVHAADYGGWGSFAQGVQQGMEDNYKHQQQAEQQAYDRQRQANYDQMQREKHEMEMRLIQQQSQLESAQIAAYNREFERAATDFLTRPENSMFIDGSLEWKVLNNEVAELQKTSLVNTLSPMELLELARKRTDKIVDLKDISEQEEIFKKEFDRAVINFLDRPENSIFIKGSKAWNVLDDQVKEVGAEIGGNAPPSEVLDVARARTAKLITIPPLPSQKKALKPVAKSKADSRRSVYL